MSANEGRLRGPWRLLQAPWLLLLLTALGCGLAAVGMGKLRNEEDILVFLPASEPEVATFKEVAQRFGAMRVALIGVAPKGGGELFSADLLGRIGRLSESLKNSAGVDRVVSLSTMTDLRPSDGGVDVQPLLPSPLPSDPAALQALKAHAMSLASVRGNVISADGKAALLMVFLSEGSKSAALAEKARALAQAELGSVASLYFGGAPFAGQAIYDDTQHDVRRLTPVAMLLFLVIVLLAFRRWLPVVLTVLTVALSVALVLGGMGFLHQTFSVVSGTLPLILFASGSQYAIHIIGRYYLVRDAQNNSSPAARLAAAVEAIRVAGPPVAVAAVNCCLGFLSFLVMNIGAMRSFGVACSAGVLCCLLFAVTVLPAVVARFEPGPAKSSEHARFAGLGRLLLWQFDFARRQRGLVVGTTALLALLCAGGLTKVTVRMEPSAFFRPGSEPALAQQFLDGTFGGAQFVQLLVEGDITDPRALSELRRLANFAQSLPDVTQVQSIVEPIALVGAGMAGLRGLPADRRQVGALLFFMEGEPSLRMLMTADRKAALLHIRVHGDPRPVVVALERYLTQRWPYSLHRPTAAELAEELGWLLPIGQAATRQATILAAVQQITAQGLSLGGPPPPAAPAGDEPASAEQEAKEAARLRAAQQVAVERLSSALCGSPRIDGTPLGSRRSDLELLAAALITPPADPAAASPTAEAGDGRLRGRLTGEPLLDRGFSRAVERNQWLSLAVALAAVLVALLLVQRSLGAALLCMLPAVMALMVVFGGLGLYGQPIDLGTSLVGSIVTSSGADFAMHYVWYLRRRPASEVVPTVGPVIFTTASLLGLGMGVMVLGGSPPIRLFGGLSCAGMLLSATFTFLLVPALLPLPAALAPRSSTKESP